MRSLNGDKIEFEPVLTDLTHQRSCPMLNPMSDDFCTCGLEWRIRLRTEMEMHNAWRKRAEEAEEALAGAASVGAGEAEIRLDEARWWNSLYVGPNCLSWFDQRGVRMAELTARALGATK